MFWNRHDVLRRIEGLKPQVVVSSGKNPPTRGHVYDTQPSSARMSMKRKNSSLVSIDSTCTLMPVRVEKSDWERVSPVMVGTGRGCVSDEMSEEVKGEGPKDVLPMDKATRDAVNAGRQYCMNSK
jgi:hypothetical protein